MVLPGYTPPGRKKLAGSMLQMMYEEEFQKLRKKLEGVDNLTLSSDGCTVHRTHYVNLMISSPDFGSSYLGFFSTPKGDTIVEWSRLALEKLDEMEERLPGLKAKIRCITTDQAANAVGTANKLADALGPTVLTHNCTAHALHNMMKNLCDDIPPVKFVVQVCSDLSSIILRSANLKQALRSNQTRSLHNPSATRWGSNVTCVEAVIANKLALEELKVKVALGRPSEGGVTLEPQKKQRVEKLLKIACNSMFIVLATEVVELMGGALKGLRLADSTLVSMCEVGTIAVGIQKHLIDFDYGTMVCRAVLHCTLLVTWLE